MRKMQIKYEYKYKSFIRFSKTPSAFKFMEKRKYRFIFSMRSLCSGPILYCSHLMIIVNGKCIFKNCSWWKKLIDFDSSPFWFISSAMELFRNERKLLFRYTFDSFRIESTTDCHSSNGQLYDQISNCKE